ncbi:MAG: type II toxin-antitoxin system HicB family antitoxin [candidate division Zixibacteria bacterium]|nr:type II toxin-antitoxin system HicB family antitoxin [candidate division Zixibacteria bacterium]
MLQYPVLLEDDDDSVLVTSPDFPELTTFGMDREEAIARATDALEEAIAARIHDGLDIPLPSKGRDVALLPTLTTVKVMLYRGMREQGIGKAELARRLGWHLPQVDRVLDVQHNSRMDQMDAAMGAIGRHLYVRDSLH